MQKLVATIVTKLYGVYLNFLALFSQKKVAKKAFYIFCTVRKGRILSHQRAFLNPARSKKHRVSDHSIQTYQWKGTKETILLVHGWESNSWRWHKLINKLILENYNIIAFDAPGHGDSSGNYLYVPLYAEIVQFMIREYGPSVLIGHSVGGMTLLYNEYKNPSKNSIQKIVTVGSPSEFYEIMAGYQKLLGFNNRVYNSLAAYIEKRFGFTVREFSTSEYVRSNTKKGLILHDKKDRIAPHHSSEQVHSNWEGSQLISTEGLGHSMHQDEVNEKIVDFLKDQ